MWGGRRNLTFMCHKFLVLPVIKWLKSVHIYGSYRKIKPGVPLFLDHSMCNRCTSKKCSPTLRWRSSPIKKKEVSRSKRFTMKLIITVYLFRALSKYFSAPLEKNWPIRPWCNSARCDLTQQRFGRNRLWYALRFRERFLGQFSCNLRVLNIDTSNLHSRVPINRYLHRLEAWQNRARVPKCPIF